MADPKTDETRTPQSEFSDPSRLDPSSARDSMQASLAEMERARASHPTPQHDDDGKSQGTGRHSAAPRNPTKGGPAARLVTFETKLTRSVRRQRESSADALPRSPG